MRAIEPTWANILMFAAAGLVVSALQWKVIYDAIKPHTSLGKLPALIVIASVATAAGLGAIASLLSLAPARSTDDAFRWICAGVVIAPLVGYVLGRGRPPGRVGAAVAESPVAETPSPSTDG